jgi:hypothetical protein
LLFEIRGGGQKRSDRFAARQTPCGTASTVYLNKKTTEEQDAEKHDDRDHDDLDQTHGEILRLSGQSGNNRAKQAVF